MFRSLILLCLALFSFSSVLDAQTVIRGSITDAISGDALIGAAAVVEGTTIGNTADLDGNFIIETNKALPLTLSVSFLGYKTQTVQVTEANKSNVVIKLGTDAVLMKAVEVKAQRISLKQQQAPLTVETMDVLGIKEAASGSFYGH